MNCIVHLNGWSGSAKRTIGGVLATQIGARLLDNHVMLKPAEALFERDNPLHAELLDASRSLTLDYAARSAPGTSLVPTDPLADDEADAATFGQFQNLAARRAARLISVVLEITPEEDVR